MIKLYLARGLGFYFCGRIALFPAEHTQSNPKVLQLEDLTESEVLGLERGVESGAIALLEGEDLLKVRVNTIKGIVEEKPEETSEPVKEDSVEDASEESTESTSETEVENTEEETSEDTVTKTPRKRTTRKTTTTK